MHLCRILCFFFFFKQKTAYEMRISDGVQTCALPISRIKEIVKALQRVLARPEVRFLGNVEFGVDVKLDDLRSFYDAVIVATGAMADRDLGKIGRASCRERVCQCV